MTIKASFAKQVSIDLDARSMERLQAGFVEATGAHCSIAHCSSAHCSSAHCSSAHCGVIAADSR